MNQAGNSGYYPVNILNNNDVMEGLTMKCKHYYPDIIEHKSHCYCDGNLPDQWHDVRDEPP